MLLGLAQVLFQLLKSNKIERMFVRFAIYRLILHYLFSPLIMIVRLFRNFV